MKSIHPNIRKSAIETLEDRRLLATFTVTTTADAGAGSLRAAVAQANAAAGADIVQFASGVAGGTIALTSGQIEITDALTIDGPAAGVTVDGQDLDRIFDVADDTVTGFAVEMNDLTLTNGNARAMNVAPADDGGAIRSSGLVDLTLNNMTISNSFAADGGGAFVGGNLITNNVDWVGNTALDPDIIASSSIGGGLFAVGDTIVLNGGSFDGNVAGGAVSGGSSVGGGGGALVSSTTSTVITDVDFVNNVSSQRGGGLVIAAENVVVNSSTFDNNEAGLLGGAIDGDFTGGAPLDMTINDSTFTNNFITATTAGFTGGGAIFSFDDVFINNSTFDGNSGTNGGQAGAINVQAAILEIDGGTFTNNTAGRGGAIAHSSPDAPAISSFRSRGAVGGEKLADGEYAASKTSEMQPEWDLSGRQLRQGPANLVNGTLNIFNSTFDTNAADRDIGGAIVTFTGDTDNVVHFSNTRVVGNSVTGVSPNGGGLFADATTLRIEKTEFSENSAAATDPSMDTGLGGAMQTQNVSTFNMINTTVAGNSADQGGGMVVTNFGVDGTFTAMHATITNNTATDVSDGTFSVGGGAIFVAGNDGGSPATGSTLDATLVNSILAGNFDGLGAANDFAAGDDPDGLPASNFNLFVNDTNILGTQFDDPMNPDPLVTDDPELMPLGFYYNQDTRSMPPAGTSSVAYNAGTDADSADTGPDQQFGTADDTTLDEDQNMLPRSVYGQVDIGAAEFALNGDANLDGTVNLSDFVILRNNFNSTTATFTTGDFNGDGVVNLQDFVILRNNFNSTIN